MLTRYMRDWAPRASSILARKMPLLPPSLLPLFTLPSCLHVLDIATIDGGSRATTNLNYVQRRHDWVGKGGLAIRPCRPCRSGFSWCLIRRERWRTRLLRGNGSRWRRPGKIGKLVVWIIPSLVANLSLPTHSKARRSCPQRGQCRTMCH